MSRRPGLMTPQRRSILDLLSSSPVPLSAKDIHRSLGAKVNLATVYRTLEHLERNGRAESFTLGCSCEGRVRYYRATSAPHTHWFHCASCHTFLPVGCPSVKAVLARSPGLRGARVLGHVMYLTGLCPSCADRKESV